jgi:hypothetical protein
MNAVLEYKDNKFADSSFGITMDVSLDSDKGVFRRYHVGNAPANWIDPLGLGAVDVIFSGIGTLDPGGTGATVGSTVGAVIGGGIGYAVGNVPGAFIGAGLGYLGGRFLGGLFDPEYAGQPNYGEEQMIRVREAGLEGEMYIDRVINKTKQLTQELQELNDWLRTRKECQKEKR